MANLNTRGKFIFIVQYQSFWIKQGKNYKEKEKQPPPDWIWKEMGGMLWELRGQMGKWANKLLG